MCGSSCRLLVLSPPGPARPAHPTSTHLASVAHGPAPAFILPRHRGLLPAPAPPRGCRVCLGRFPTFPGRIPSALCVKESPKHNTEPHPCRAGHCRRVPRRPFSPGRGPRLHSPVVVHARGHTCREKHTHPGVVSMHDRDTPSSFSSHFADVARIFSSWSLLRLQSGKKNRFSVIQMIQIPKLGYQKYSRCVIKKKKKAF